MTHFVEVYSFLGGSQRPPVTQTFCRTSPVFPRVESKSVLTDVILENLQKPSLTSQQLWANLLFNRISTTIALYKNLPWVCHFGFRFWLLFFCFPSKREPNSGSIRILAASLQQLIHHFPRRLHLPQVPVSVSASRSHRGIQNLQRV